LSQTHRNQYRFINSFGQTLLELLLLCL